MNKLMTYFFLLLLTPTVWGEGSLFLFGGFSNGEFQNTSWIFTPDSAVDNTRIDNLYNWVENEYPNFFPTHTTSSTIIGYYARYYKATDVYIGTKDGRLFVYGKKFEGLVVPGLLQDLGEIETWFATAGL